MMNSLRGVEELYMIINIPTGGMRMPYRSLKYTYPSACSQSQCVYLLNKLN